MEGSNTSIPQVEAGGVLPNIDLQHAWFSKRGSWLTLYPANSSHLKLYYSYLSSDPEWMDLAFTRDGSVVETTISATPAHLGVEASPAGQGSARVVLSGARDTLIESSNLGIQISPVQQDCNFAKLIRQDDHAWSTTWKNWTVEFVVLKGKAAGLTNGCWLVEPEHGQCRMAIRIFKDQPLELPLNLDKAEAANVADWRRFRSQMPSVPAQFVAAAEQAWLTLWFSTATEAPNFPNEPVLMSKALMNSVWPWDHCFNALALGITDVNAGLDQLMLPFALQKENGQIPDKTGPEDAFWGCTKPPIHGWALGKLMDMHPVSNKRLEVIYPKLVKWTTFWFTDRDINKNGLPGFSGVNPGWDSGWDNSTVSGGSIENEAPELQAYLILQMRTLARVADQLGLESEATQWRNRAAKHLALFQKTYWLDANLVTRLDGGMKIIKKPTSLEPMMSLILGRSLEPDTFAGMVKNLDNFMTPFGLASEMPASPNYEPHGYWRGPIWAPAIYLVIDGLNRGGQHEKAVDLAQRYDRLIQKAGGYYENFDAKTGQGLCTKSYTWSAAVHILLLHEYGDDFK